MEENGEEVFRKYVKEKLGGWALIDSNADMTKTHNLLEIFEVFSNKIILF